MIYRLIGFVLAGIMAWLALAQYACVDDVNRSSELKEHPEILDMADELFANITYEDKFMMISDRLIASAKKPFEIAFLEEVYMVHISKESMNFIPTGKELHISHARGEIVLNIYGEKKSTVEGLFERLRPLCPNACAGYTQDNLKYLAYKRKQWANGVGVVPVKRPDMQVSEE